MQIEAKRWLSDYISKENVTFLIFDNYKWNEISDLYLTSDTTVKIVGRLRGGTDIRKYFEVNNNK